MNIRITEYLEIDLEKQMWKCQRCGKELIEATANYKRGCLVAERPLDQVHPPITDNQEYSFSPDPDFCRLIEFYCPSCGIMIENEYLPPGHPITHDIELDMDDLKRRYGV